MEGAEMGEADPDELLAVAVDVARQAAELAVARRVDGIGEVGTKSTATDLVTAADRAVERLIVKLLRERRPDDEVLGEEYGGGPPARELAERPSAADPNRIRWVVDPIDGTVNYLYEVPAYAVSVAVVVGDPTVQGGWRPVAGAISDPSLRLVHHARRGGGSWTRPEAPGDGPDVRLTVSTEDRIGRALLATGFGYAPEVRARQAEVLRRVLPVVRDIRRIGSAALDLVRVADGSVDAYAESGINAWDLAAGWLIVEEAGGVVVGELDLPGKALTVAAGPALVEPVRALFTGQ
jgi:myo-inositol-1(or 4)-monophosphatase